IVWSCLPRFDSEPVFSTLLDEKEGGQFLVGPAEGGTGTQRYLENTNVLETVFKDGSGSFRVLDLAPRFSQYDRVLRLTPLIRLSSSESSSRSLARPASGSGVSRGSAGPRAYPLSSKAPTTSDSRAFQTRFA